MNNVKITHLAPIGFSIIILLAIIVNLIYQSATKSIVKSSNWVSHTYQVKLYLTELQKILVDAETGQRGFLYAGQEKFLEPYQDADSKLKEQIKKINFQIKDNPAQVQRLANVQKLAQEKMNNLAITIAMKRQNQEQALKAEVLSGVGKQIMDNFRDKANEMAEVEESLLVERQSAALQAQNMANNLAWGSILLLIGVGVVISLLITRIITSSLNRAVRVAERVSDGDLTTQVETISNDEIGKLLNSFRVMTQNLNSLIGQVQNSGILVTTSTTQIAASGKELEATVTEQVASTNQVLVTAKEIAATSEQLLHTMEEVVTTSQTTATAADSGQRDLIRMETTMRQLATATSSISVKLGVISEKANNINGVVTTITKVADQTNLLSLNAAIEAEKAGEYGLGFGVVAREIRRLADQTAIATLDIEQMVKEMQSAVSTGVMEMDKFTKEVNHSVDDVGKISLQIAEIIDQVQALIPRFGLVNEGMEAQSQGAGQISEAMIQLSESSSQTADSLREINRAIEQLRDVSQGLRLEISRFKVS